MRERGLSWVVAALAAGFLILLGGWAFVHPSSFFERIATFPPYNRHFLHDVGAFQIGLGAVLVASLVWRDGLLVALAGNAVGAVLHLLSHVLDRSLGGSASDFVVLGAVALLLVFAAGARLQALRR